MLNKSKWNVKTIANEMLNKTKCNVKNKQNIRLKKQTEGYNSEQ